MKAVVVQAIVDYASGGHASGGRVCKRWSCKGSRDTQSVTRPAIVATCT